MNGFSSQSPELLSAAAAAAVCVRMCVVMPMSVDYIITERREGPRGVVDGMQDSDWLPRQSDFREEGRRE